MFDMNFNNSVADSFSGIDAGSMGHRGVGVGNYNRPIGPSLSEGTSFAGRYRSGRAAARASWRMSSTLKVAALGGLSALTPLEDPLMLAARQARDSALGPSGRAAVKEIGNALPSGMRGLGSKALGAAARWGGPITAAYRLSNENDFSSIGGFADKSTRIIAEEVVWGASMAVGMKVGASIGAFAGGFVTPGIGNVIGFAAGAVVGGIIGAGGAWAVNRAIDIAEVPFKVGAAGYRYLKNTGKDRRLELGGQMSAGNASRHGYTMRQRALQQMNRSGMNTRSLLGQEASMMHIR